MNKEDRVKLDNMQTLREKENLTQVKLSMLVGVSQQSITFYESSTRLPSLPVALKIAKVLHTSVEGLIDKNDIIAKYHALPINDQETVNLLIETLYEKIDIKK